MPDYDDLSFTPAQRAASIALFALLDLAVSLMFFNTPAAALFLAPAYLLFAREQMPDFEQIEKIDRSDGVKLWFRDGSWVICRFSGTEPLLRMAAEAAGGEQAQHYIETWREFLDL